MAIKIPLELKTEYNKLKSELKKLRAESNMDLMKNEILERIIFKNLPQICVNCGDTRHLSLDHIVPQSILKDLNVNEIIEENYQILCKYCNGKKANRLDIREKKVVEILKKIVNNL